MRSNEEKGSEQRGNQMTKSHQKGNPMKNSSERGNQMKSTGTKGNQMTNNGTKGNQMKSNGTKGNGMKNDDTKGNQMKRTGTRSGEMKSTAKKTRSRTSTTKPQWASARVLESLALLDRVDAIVPPAVELTVDERVRSAGKLLSGESGILHRMLDVVEHHPQYFPQLGADAMGKPLSAAGVRALLEERDELERLSLRMEEVQVRLSDTVLRLGELTRKPLLTAYEVARTVGQMDPELKGRIAPIVNFYGRNARKGAATRAANSEAAAADTSPQILEPADA